MKIKQLKTRWLLLLSLFCGVTFTNCNVVKSISLLTKGKAAKKQFKTTIPFRYEQGTILIAVELGGREYDFILDTGGFNLISDEIAKRLGVVSQMSSEVGDSQGNSSDLNFVRLDKVTIGGVDFVDMGAGVLSLEEVSSISCLKADGMIGANLMREANWEVDYQKQQITIADLEFSFSIPPEATTLSFSSNLVGTPKVDLFLNSVKEKKVIVDLGMRSAFKFPNETFVKLQEANQLGKTTYGEGILAAGLHGYGEEDRDQFSLIDKLSIGTIELKNQVVTFVEPEASSKIGNAFLENYRLIFNWEKKELTMIEERNFENNQLENFGFKPIFKEDQLQVGYLYNNSAAQKAGLHFGDHIVQLGGQDCLDISKEEACILRAAFRESEKEKIKIEVLRDGNLLSFDISKTKLL